MNLNRMSSKLKKLPIGIDSFEQVISGNYYYADKTLLVKDLLDVGAMATLFPRPRRFGKTLNMTMLQCFFEKNEVSKRHLFEGLAVTEHPDIMAHQGQYPVIFFTLKFVDSADWETCYASLKQLIADEFRRHRYLVESPALHQDERDDFAAIMSGQASEAFYQISLKKLTAYLEQHHKKSPIVLIDEYDVPIHNGFVHGYYNQVRSFTRAFFGDALKGNQHISSAVLTSTLHVADECIFAGFDNLLVCTMLHDMGANRFGLLEDEVQELLQNYDLGDQLPEVRCWYNGYTSGPFTIYNPWSLINFVDSKGELQPYWMNASNNEIIKKLIQVSCESVKAELEILLAGGVVTEEICENIVYAELATQTTMLWNFLRFSGYLTTRRVFLASNNLTYADFVIPNIEVSTFYQTTISGWFELDDSDVQSKKVALAVMMSC